MPGVLLGLSVSPVVVGFSGAGGGWWLAGGIPAANCLEHVELPSIGQQYAGGSVASNGQLTVAFRTVDSSATQYVLDFNGTAGRLAMGYVPQNGFYDGIWYGGVDVPLFTSGDHVYFLVRNATGAQCYRDNVAVGSFYSNFGAGINGTNGARWRSLYNNAGANQWTNDVPGAAVYNIALSAGQRAGLYAAMASL